MGISQQIGSSSQIKPGVCTSTTRPASPYTGQVIFETDTNRMLVWNTTAWVIPNSPAQNPMGLELVKTQTISGTVASVTVTNAFSTTYDNYRVMISGVTATAGDVWLKLTYSNQTFSPHAHWQVYNNYGTGTAGVQTLLNETYALAFIVGTYGGAHMEFYNPFLAKETTFTAQGSSNSYQSQGGGRSYDQTSTTSFTLTPNSGSLSSGTIYVFGYRK